MKNVIKMVKTIKKRVHTGTTTPHDTRLVLRGEFSFGWMKTKSLRPRKLDLRLGGRMRSLSLEFLGAYKVRKI